MAESEEDVSEEDRKLHERIASEVKSQLEAKGKSTEGVETFEEFYGLLRSEAVVLQKKYQPQLRDGIKIAVDLINSVKEDAKDGDVDIKVKIAPNATFKVIAINFIDTTDDDELAKITPDDRAFIDSVQEATDNILSNYEKEVDGKNNASKAIFETIQAKVQILVNEYKSELEYGDISMLLSGGRENRELSFIRIYTKNGNNINVSLGSIKVDLEKIIKEKEDPKLFDKGYEVPKGYSKTNFFSKTDQRVYYDSKSGKYISRDIADGGKPHGGGIWKMADSVENLNSKKTRMGTYDKNLKWIKD